MRVPRRRPHHVVLRQPDVYQRPDRRRMPNGPDPADHLPRPGADRPRVGPGNRDGPNQGSHPRGIHPVRPAGHHEERLSVRGEHQAVGDRTDLTAELRRRGRRGGCRLGQHLHRARHAKIPQHAREPGEVNRRHAPKLSVPAACRSIGLSRTNSAYSPTVTVCRAGARPSLLPRQAGAARTSTPPRTAPHN
jgi:hypothetical protein